MAKLVACLATLRGEFNANWPKRPKGSDGWIGDAAHRKRSSDHNPDETGTVPVRDADHVDEVHAIDITRFPELEKTVQFLLTRCRVGAETRLRYIIYDRRIWEADNGWRQREHTGSDPHIEHAHFSSKYDDKSEASTAPWHLEMIPVALTPDDKKWISGEIRAVVNEIVGFTTGDVVPRWSDAGEHVPASTKDKPVDQTLTLREAMFYVGATAKRTENATAEILDKLDLPAG